MLLNWLKNKIYSIFVSTWFSINKLRNGHAHSLLILIKRLNNERNVHTGYVDLIFGFDEFFVPVSQPLTNRL